MRRFKTIMTLIFCTSVFTLTACKQEKTQYQGETVFSDKQAQSPDPKTTQQKENLQKEESLDEKKASADASANRCFENLCVDKKELFYSTIMEKAAVSTEDQKTYYTKYIATPTLAAIKESKTTLETFSDLLKEKEPEFENIQLSETQMRLIKAILLATSSKYISKTTQEKYAELSKSYDFIKASSLVALKGPQYYFLSLYPETPLTKALQAEADKIVKTQEKINQTVKARILNFEVRLLSKMKNGEGINTEDLKDMAQTSVVLRLIEALTIKDTSLTDSIELNHKQVLKIYNDGNLRNNILSELEKHGTFAEDCEKNYYRAINLAPQADEIKNFQELDKKVRPEVLSLLNENDPAYKKIQKAVLYMPDNSKKITSRWLARLKIETLDTLRDRQLITKIDLAGFFTFATLYSQTFSKEKNLCDKLADLNISDFAHTINGGIKVSWFSVKYPAYGVTILAHEFGHIISKFSNAFSKQKKCLAEKQGSPKYSEEDFADFIGGKVSLQLQNIIPNQGNFGCVASLSGQKNSLVNSSTDDVHSSNLYRALQISLLRKESIPESCQELTKTQAPNALNLCD
ncbi:MAG: hypothetical protein ACXVCY_12145 [Pseudobdellovibrionaceae bacterium]